MNLGSCLRPHSDVDGYDSNIQNIVNDIHAFPVHSLVRRVDTGELPVLMIALYFSCWMGCDCTTFQ